MDQAASIFSNIKENLQNMSLLAIAYVFTGFEWINMGILNCLYHFKRIFC